MRFLASSGLQRLLARDFVRWKDREIPGISRFPESGSYVEFLEQNKNTFEQDRFFSKNMRVPFRKFYFGEEGQE